MKLDEIGKDSGRAANDWPGPERARFAETGRGQHGSPVLRKGAIAGVLALVALVVALWTGCARYKIQPIAASELKGWATNRLSEGYVFYQPELYFVVTYATNTNKQTTLTVTPVYLPNYQKPYRLTTCNFLAKADFAFDFENGWKLTKLSDKSDNSTVANTLAGELKTILSLAGLGVAKADEKPLALMYHGEFNEEGIFTGFRPVAFRVPEEPAP
jgi:hypothetical protein